MGGAALETAGAAESAGLEGRFGVAQAHTRFMNKKHACVSFEYDLAEHKVAAHHRAAQPGVRAHGHG